MKWIVAASEAGLALQLFLKEKLGANWSVKQIKRALEANACKVNGSIERFGSRRVDKGALIEFHAAAPKAAFPKKAVILFEDEWVMACNKPAGMVCSEEGLKKYFTPAQGRLELVHRLDRDTTGILLLAKTGACREALETLFRKREVHKSYLALVDGKVLQEKGVIHNYLFKAGAFEGQTIWRGTNDKAGLEAVSSWERVAIGKGCTLLRFFPKTGRTHQIRVHCSGMGHPILGDAQYARQFICGYPAGRVFLHAEKIAFTHPFTGKELQLQIAPPEDFQNACQELGIRV